MVPSIRSFRAAKDPKLSPTLSATTTASALDLGDDGPRVIISRADLRSSIAAYESLLAAAKAYRTAMTAMSAASTAFAGALEECARVKGAGESGENLLAASGLQYMIANSGQVLSDTLYRSFEIPLLHAYDTYVSTSTSRHSDYEALLAERTAAIRQTEADNLKQGRKKSRDLSQFRRALERLQEQVMEVEAVKRSYYNEVLEHEAETWELISGKVALILRSTLDLSDRLASKATSDPVIESMLQEHPDPFDSYRTENEEERDVFTILPPLGMNLGLGGSKRGSVIDLDKEAERERERTKEDASSTLTPRQGSRKGSISVAEVLGINAGTETDSADETEPESADERLEATPRHQRPAQHPPPPPHDNPFASSSPVSPSTANDSPVATTSTNYDSSNAPDSPSPARTASNGLSAKAQTPTPTKKKGGGKSKSRRELSRVAEMEVDPMAGEWGNPEYGKSLSPVMNGSDSGEDEPYSRH